MNTQGGDVTDDLEFHPYANHFPLMEGDEFQDLVEDIAENGLLEPIVVHDGKILDGRNRYRACREAGVEPEVREYEGDSPISYVISMNARRRHMTKAQLALAVRELKGELQAEVQNQRSEMARETHRRDPETGDFAGASPAGDASPGRWSEKAGEKAGVSRHTVERVDRVAREAENPDSPHREEAEEMVEGIRQGDLGAKTAERRLKELERERKQKEREAQKTEEERRQEAAAEAVASVRKKGASYLDALRKLFMEHRDALDGEMAMNIATTLHEHRGLLAKHLPGGFLREDAPEQIKSQDGNEPIEVDHELVG